MTFLEVMTMEVKLTDVIAPSFYSVHHAIREKRYSHYWLKGGRGSTKSSFVSIEIIKGMMADPDANAVILRKVKETLRESVYEQMLWAIDKLNVSHLWHESLNPLSITYKPTGQKIIFKGADKPKRLNLVNSDVVMQSLSGMKKQMNSLECRTSEPLIKH